MTPTELVLAAIGPALAADEDTFAPETNANKFALITADFAEGSQLVIGSLTLATLAGLTAITGVAGAQLESREPLTGDVMIENKVPVGGLRWESTADDGYPVTIYGVALINNGGTALLGTEKLAQPVQIGGKNQAFVKDRLAMRIPKASIR